MENIGVGVVGEEPCRQLGCAQQCADDVGVFFGMPVASAKTTLALGRIAMSAGHVMCKARFINVNNGLTHLAAHLNAFEEVPLVIVLL